MMPETVSLLLSRRSVKAGQMIEPGPTAEHLDWILHAAIRIPDHGKLAPWRIRVLDKPAQATLGDRLAEYFQADHPEAKAKKVESERERPQRAPLLLVIASTPVEHHKVPEIEQRLSAGACCQNILVAASALGYASQWLTEWPCYDDRVRTLLGFDGPDDRLVGFVYLGSTPEKPEDRRRPVFEEVVAKLEPNDLDRSREPSGSA